LWNIEKAIRRSLALSGTAAAKRWLLIETHKLSDLKGRKRYLNKRRIGIA
jgi:hypothetical protein